MKNIKIFITLILSSFYILTSISNAEVYKWVDENGKVHFSDKKIQPTAEEVEIKSNNSSLNQLPPQNPSNQTNSKQKYLDFLESERQEKQEQKEKKKQQAAKQKRYCTNLKDQLQSYEEDRSLWYDLDEETGKRNYISDDDLQKRINELREEINSRC